ncbi:MAG: GrpB family protein [Burkholderiales bacterium]|nr:GrpB family protein [Burkholderiales bacterium]
MRTALAEAVLLSPPDPAWPSQAATLLAELTALLGGADIRGEHIGSTAVAGLSAKPVLDLMIGVPSLAHIERHHDALKGRGWRYRPEHEARLPQRRYFVRDASGDWPRVHLHALVQGGALWLAHLRFRDALRASPALRDEYARLKQRLAVAFAGDKAAYTEAKAPFIQQVLRVEG